MKSAFIDTNVLLYMVDPRDPVKRQRAIDVVAEWAGRFAISIQVLQEFYWSATRKLGIPPSEARDLVLLWSRKRVVQAGPDLVIQAIDTGERYQVSFWDATIVEAAIASGADVLLTEDLSHGQVIRGLRVHNPFTS